MSELSKKWSPKSKPTKPFWWRTRWREKTTRWFFRFLYL